MDFEDYQPEKPVYATTPIKPEEQRVLCFEAETSSPERREFAEHGLRAVVAWSDDPQARLQIDRSGNLRFLVRPGSLVYATVKSA